MYIPSRIHDKACENNCIPKGELEAVFARLIFYILPLDILLWSLNICFQGEELIFHMSYMFYHPIVLQCIHSPHTGIML